MKRILLIEDNNEMRENTAEILSLSKYSVFTAKNGKEGVALALQEKPDLIICDIMMPLLDGYGVLHLLGKDSETSGIPFIFLTAKAERSDFRKGMEMGADDYVTKPFDEIELLNAIESRLKKSEALKKEFTKNMQGLDEFIDSAKNFEDLKKLSEKNDVTAIKKKEYIYLEGNAPRGLYFINKGKIKTFRTNDDGKEKITGLYKEGDFFGYLALLEDNRYKDSSMTLEDSEVCLISKEDFFNLLYKNAEVAKRFIKLLSDNLEDKEEQLIKLAYNSVRKRVSEALITLYKLYHSDETQKSSFNITRENLANIVGTAPESAIRTLSDFKDEGLIDISGGNITIINFDRLNKLKN